jgi:outer membrane protein insertion porin family
MISRTDVHTYTQVSENAETPLRISAIRVLGANSTRPSFLAHLCSPYLSSDDTTTLADVLERTRALSNRLASFDIFSSLSASIEKSPSIFASDQDVDVVLNVQEKSRFFVRTATDVGNGEGNATGTARVRNAFGGAETLEANVAFGTKTKSSFQIKIESPIPTMPSPDTKIDLTAFAADRDLTHFASCRERTQGAAARMRTLSRLGYHEFGYEAILRHISDLEPNASMTCVCSVCCQKARLITMLGSVNLPVILSSPRYHTQSCMTRETIPLQQQKVSISASFRCVRLFSFQPTPFYATDVYY